MSPEESKLLFYISKVVDKQSDNIDDLKKDLHALNLRFVALEVTGRVIMPKEYNSSKVKQTTTAATLGGFLGFIINVAFEYLKTR